jgi:NAD(P)-dependent dehydrogenase (short-subunit alcohol dehydrogenase family)
MKIDGTVALVTGGNRGLGRAFTRALLNHGAKTVYAAARDSRTVSDPDVIPITLDVTAPEQIIEAVETVGKVDIIINNAGVATWGPPLEVTMEDARQVLEVNYLGTLAMAQAFSPLLAQSGGGALVNILSVASFVASPRLSTYGASKAAAWSITNALRVQMRRQGTLVIGVHAGFIDTEMVASVEDEKISPELVASLTMEAILADEEEVLADELTRSVKSSLNQDHELIYPSIQQRYDAAIR